MVKASASGIIRTCYYADGMPPFTWEAPEDSFPKLLHEDQVTIDFGDEIYEGFRRLVQEDPKFFTDKSELTEWDGAIHTSAGWPSLALRGTQHLDLRYWFRSANPRHLIGAIAIPKGLLGLKHGNTLPLHPIWSGFASNTTFYAMILWILWRSPFTARRFIRSKRGHCIKCGYDLRGTFEGGGVCPECGN